MLFRKSTSRDRLAAVGCNRHGAMGRFWHGLHRHALMTMIAYAFLQHFRIAKTGRKNESTARHLSPTCQPRVPPSSLSFFSHQIRDTDTAEHRSAKSKA